MTSLRSISPVLTQFRNHTFLIWAPENAVSGTVAVWTMTKRPKQTTAWFCLSCTTETDIGAADIGFDTLISEAKNHQNRWCSACHATCNTRDASSDEASAPAHNVLVCHVLVPKGTSGLVFFCAPRKSVLKATRNRKTFTVV